VANVPTLTCPACGHQGEVDPDFSGNDEFERRGKTPEGGLPVMRCNNCQGGLVVRPRFLFFGPKARAIPPTLWERMVRMFDEATRAQDLQCPACGKAMVTGTALRAHLKDKHGIEVEA
jgi:predicted RNA-binding Zn-ribbon protein involved in translation (DUF1610 family)